MFPNDSTIGLSPVHDLYVQATYGLSAQPWVRRLSRTERILQTRPGSVSWAVSSLWCVHPGNPDIELIGDLP